MLPSVGDTYFFAVWQLLGDISKTEIGAHDVPIALVTSSLLTLYDLNLLTTFRFYF